MDACVGAWAGVDGSLTAWPGDQTLFDYSNWDNRTSHGQLDQYIGTASQQPDNKNHNSSTRDILFCGYTDGPAPSDVSLIYPSPAVAVATIAEPGQALGITMPSIDGSSMARLIQHQNPTDWPQNNLPLSTTNIPECAPYPSPNEFAWSSRIAYGDVGPSGHLAYMGQDGVSTSASSSPMISGLGDGDDLEVGYGQTSAWDGMEGVEPVDPCYAQLLYNCLSEAPNHTLTLKELYEWVREHSQKAKDPTNKGWQNSVRHNLSMNAAFERVTNGPSHNSKKGSSWRLTPAALRDGVISTTRYRREPKHKTIRRGAPQLKRQISGAKGGQATRNAARHQRALREARSLPNFVTRPHQQQFLVEPPRSIAAQDQQWLPTSQPPLPPPPPPYPSSFVPMPFPPPQQATSPYYPALDEVNSPVPAPNTPPQVLFPLGTQVKTSLPDWTAGYINYSTGGIVGEYDDFSVETPTTTEASYMSEDMALP